MLSVKQPSKRVISLPAIYKQVRLGAYVEAIKMCKQHPDMTFKHGLTTWASCTGKEILQQFRRGMHQRINEAKPYIQRGRDEPTGKCFDIHDRRDG